MYLKHQRDFFSGLMFMATGLAFAWSASRYSVGSAMRMGPGYFPLLLGGLLALLGGVLLFKALVLESEDGGRLQRWAWRPMLCVTLASGAMGVLMAGVPAVGLPPMGLVMAVVLSTLLAGAAAGSGNWREVTVLALLLAAIAYLVCVLLLQLPLPVWPGVAAS